MMDTRSSKAPGKRARSPASDIVGKASRPPLSKHLEKKVNFIIDEMNRLKIREGTGRRPCPFVVACAVALHNGEYADEGAAKVAFDVHRTTRVGEKWAESLRLLDEAKPELLRATAAEIDGAGLSCSRA